MNGFERIQESLFAIRTVVLGNEGIRKLLCFDVRNPLQQNPPTFTKALEHTQMSPIFNVNVEPYNKNTFITFVISKGDLDENNSHEVAIRISIISRNSLWELESNKIRPLEIASEIVKILENRKVSASHKLIYEAMQLVVLNEDYSGYNVQFTLIDGGGLENEI